MNLSYSNTTGDATNNWYGNSLEIHDVSDLACVCGNDYTAVKFKDGFRSNKNFIRADVVILDIDNNHSDDPEQWVMPKMILEAFPNVRLGIHFSRNHMKEKDGKAARPRFHVIFMAEPITDARLYSEIAKSIARLFPYFDTNALDAARFFFGTENPEVQFCEGDMSITEFLKQQGCYPTLNQLKASPSASYTETMKPTASVPQISQRLIPEGQRNTTLYMFAVRQLKRYGCTQEVYDSYRSQAALCDPPLGESEIKTIWNSASSFYENEIKGSPGYVPPAEYNNTTHTVDARVNDGGNGYNGIPTPPGGSSPGVITPPKLCYKPDDLTDVGQAVLLRNCYWTILMYVSSHGHMVYDGTRWKQDDATARLCAQELSRLQLKEATSYFQFWDQQAYISGSSFNKAIIAQERRAAKEYLSFAKSRRKSCNISSTLKEFDALVKVDVERLDADPYLLCTPEGTYDLRKGLAGKQPNAPANLITKVTKYSPSDIGKDIWYDFIETVFCHDKELIEYVHMLCGLAAIGQVKIEALFIAYGGGRNGKSTFWNSIGHVLGDYFGKISSQALAANQFSSGNVGAEMANLQGKRLCIASESREGSRLNEAAVKQITSTDDIFANPKYRDPFSFTPSHTVVMYTNHLPKVQDLDEGTWRRLVVIPFEAYIQPADDKKNYADYLETNCGGSIMAWIIDGARKICELNFQLPTPVRVQKAIGTYFSDNDWFQDFFEKYCEWDSQSEVQAGVLYNAYSAYASSSNIKPRNAIDFNKDMDKRGLKSVKKQNRKFYQGIKLQNNP